MDCIVGRNFHFHFDCIIMRLIYKFVVSDVLKSLLNTENNSKTYTMSQINTFTCELQKDVKGASQVHTAPESKEQSMGS